MIDELEALRAWAPDGEPDPEAAVRARARLAAHIVAARPERHRRRRRVWLFIAPPALAGAAAVAVVLSVGSDVQDGQLRVASARAAAVLDSAARSAERRPAASPFPGPDQYFYTRTDATYLDACNGHEGPKADQVAMTRDSAQKSDVVLLVLHARNPARQADVEQRDVRSMSHERLDGLESVGRFGDHVKRQGRLARRLRPEDLDDAAARHAADAERGIERKGARGDGGDVDLVAAAQPHDRALAELLIDLGEGGLDRLPPLLVVSHELVLFLSRRPPSRRISTATGGS